MRVLIVSNQYPPAVGGIETLLPPFVDELRARGHVVTVITGALRDVPARHLVGAVTVHRFDVVRAVVGKDAVRFARCRAEIRAIVAEFGPDVIHCHDCGPLAWITASCGVPTVGTLHVSLDRIDATQFEPMARQIMGWARTTAVARAVAAQLVERLPAMADRVSVIPNGIPETGREPAAVPQHPVVLGAGRFVEQKGFDVLIDAFALVVEQSPNAELLLVGDGHLRAELSARVQRLGLADRVRMPGAVAHGDMPDMYAAASVVAMPSRWEGMPLVALEAALAGRAVVATPVQGLADVVVDGETGSIVPCDDPAQLARALLELVTDPDRAGEMGAAARRRALTEHSVATMTTRFERLYADVLAAP